jgi:hypothetical protein
MESIDGRPVRRSEKKKSSRCKQQQQYPGFRAQHVMLFQSFENK